MKHFRYTITLIDNWMGIISRYDGQYNEIDKTVHCIISYRESQSTYFYALQIFDGQDLSKAEEVYEDIRNHVPDIMPYTSGHPPYMGDITISFILSEKFQQYEEADPIPKSSLVFGKEI